MHIYLLQKKVALPGSTSIACEYREIASWKLLDLSWALPTKINWELC